ncbi:unnamed protein product [Polarella glacialis]|uniref:Gamma-glutamylcyclotransferase AIG2-like domain-containing protein n=1 Tax=Polarella glacialis TaxID=89957 RepID=A0A813EHN2_POLGL|nr:unnamed protein product [Polarella glacialis]
MHPAAATPGPSSSTAIVVRSDVSEEDDVPVRAVFAYGTLRGDFGPEGDHWGVIESTGAAWYRTTVRGYRLHQEEGLFYPFAVQTGSLEDVITGTLLLWAPGEVARRAIARCDQIEGFNPHRPLHGLYRRAQLEVELPPAAVADSVDAGWLDRDIEATTIRAFIYHQLQPPAAAGKSILSFPGGDWLASRQDSERSCC